MPEPLPAAFRRLAASNLAAQAAEQVALAAAPLLAVLALGAGAAGAGWLQAAQTLPFLLLSLPAGLLADSTSRRRLMLGAELLRAASLLGILALLLGGGLSLPWLAALGFLGATGTVAYSVAAPALLPALVARGRLAEANRWLELARSTAFAAGPALGGALLGGLGGAAAFALAAGLSLLAARAKAGLPDPAPAPAPRRTALAGLREGAGFVLGHPLLRPVLVTAVVFNTAWFLLLAVYAAYAVERLGLSAAGTGVTLGLYGAGMVAGAALAPPLLRRLPFGRLVAVGPCAGLLAALLMLASLGAPHGAPGAALAGASLFLFGAGPILWTIATTTLRQAVTPDRLLGRVSAVVMTATFGARPLGAALGALLAARLGVEACLAAAALGFLVQALVIAASPVPRLTRLPAATTG
ncbi:MFS transporter [Roseomonas sp. KE0001]|uniref:MFS transporter n=1 Tax=Roseomonas sp. KE0001 TaxID=2479201 RepID=UPI0018DFD3B8|nr:MFS transporter [Roseomonas sp. KE0001]MBI0434030.1 MFS transporter [Roseomonas sp. KE0001]